MDFEIIKKAGITQAQFGRLVGATRVTVNTWVNGKFKPKAAITDRVSRALEVLRAAVERGTLPQVVVAPSEQVDAIVEKLAAQLNKPARKRG